MTFAAQLRRWARESPAKPAAVDSGRRLTYAELDGLVDSVAGCLIGEGVGPGSVVSSQLPNRIESLTLALAANRIGAVHNPIVVTHGRRELAFILDQAGSAVLVTDDRLEHGRAGAVGVDAPFDPDAVAFLLYTSGTEADPKGVIHSNRTLLAECEAQV